MAGRKRSQSKKQGTSGRAQRTRRDMDPVAKLRARFTEMAKLGDKGRRELESAYWAELRASLEADPPPSLFDVPEIEEYRKLKPSDWHAIIERWERSVELLAQAMVLADSKKLAQLLRTHDMDRTERLICLAIEDRDMPSTSVLSLGECFRTVAQGFTDDAREDRWRKFLRRAQIAVERLRQRFALESTEQRSSTTQVPSGQSRESGLEDLPGRFHFAPGQVLFDRQDLKLPAGLPIDVLTKLVGAFGRVVSHRDLHSDSAVSEASEQLRGTIRLIRSAFKAGRVPAEIANKRGEGYLIRPRSHHTSSY